MNSYIQAPVTAKVWTTLCPEFGKDAGKAAVIIGALYGLIKWKQLIEATLPDAWNLCKISLIRLTKINGSNHKSNKKMGYSINPIYCVLWMAFLYPSQCRCCASMVT